MRAGVQKLGSTVRARRGGQVSLSDMVATEIGRRIVAGRYQPGTTLPTEPRIQEEFSVSRTAVREAVRLLSAKGLTVSRPKIGTRVRPVAEWNMLDPDVLRWHVDQEPTEEFIEALFDMREIIEPAAASRAAERGSDTQVAGIARAMEGIQTMPRGSNEQIKADLDFHMLILDTSRNPILRSFGALIESTLAISFSMSWRVVMKDDAVYQHLAVFEAIRDHRPEDAYLAMRKLLRNAKGDVFDAIWAQRRGRPDGRGSPPAGAAHRQSGA